MNDVYITLTGNVTHDPRQYPLADGSRVTAIRVATSRRYLDRRTQEWMSSPPSFYAVRCYRGLADNVAQSIRRGHPVVVHGRLRIREFERDGERRVIAEVEASSVGHDLKWGIATFEKPPRAMRAVPGGGHGSGDAGDGAEWAGDVPGDPEGAGHGGGPVDSADPADPAAGLLGDDPALMVTADMVTADAAWGDDERRPAAGGIAA
jgi:single-strand DNA-binding protein